MTMPVIPGMPGFRSTKTAVNRIIFRDGVMTGDLSGGKVIDGVKSGDPGNTGDVNVIRPGMLMGKITSAVGTPNSVVGCYAPSVIGVGTDSVGSSTTTTTITVSPAQAVELVRRNGASTGTLVVVSPPAAAGTVAVLTPTFTAVNQSTGAITVSSLAANIIAGALIGLNDGSIYPVTVIPDGYGVLTTDSDGTTRIPVPFNVFPTAGTIITANLLPVWPTDTSLQQWIYDKLNANGKFIFDYKY